LPSDLVVCNFVIPEKWLLPCVFLSGNFIKSEIVTIISFGITRCISECKITLRRKPDGIPGLTRLIVGQES